MSAGSSCTCGRKRGDHTDLVVIALKGNCSAFNGYHWTRSDWSAVRCLRAGCSGNWRTKADYVYDLPNCTGNPGKVEKEIERVRSAGR